MSIEEELDFLQSLCGEDVARTTAAALDSPDGDVLVGDGLELLLIDPLEEDGAVPGPTHEGESKKEADRGGDGYPPPLDAVSDRAPVESQQQRERSAPKQSTYVNRTKQELEYLRREIVELEEQLARAKSAPAAPRDALLVGQRRGTTSLWERLANRQKEERRKAEIENEKLREMLDGQLRIARSLEKVLRKRAATTSVSTFGTVVSACKGVADA